MSRRQSSVEMTAQATGEYKQNGRSYPWLLLLAVVSAFTGFKVNYLPFKLSPCIFGASGALLVAGALQ